MAKLHFSESTRICIVIGISFSFLIAEIVVGFKTGALVLVADAFHCLNDVVTFVVALSAIRLMKRKDTPANLTFGWQRAAVLGAFFNSVFLLALGFAIFMQAIERFITLNPVDQPNMLLIMGCVGVVINITMASIYHGHHEHGDHEHGEHAGPHADSLVSLAIHDEEAAQAHQQSDPDIDGIEKKSPSLQQRFRSVRTRIVGNDLGRQAVVLHIVGDAANNVGVIIASLIMMYGKSRARFYADPAVSVFIAISIFLSALPLTKKTGLILLGSLPPNVDVSKVAGALEGIPGVHSVHDLHIWQLSQEKSIASAHVVLLPGTSHSHGGHVNAPVVDSTERPENVHGDRTGPDSSASWAAKAIYEVEKVQEQDDGSETEPRDSVIEAIPEAKPITERRTEPANEHLYRMNEALRRALKPWGFYSMTFQIEEYDDGIARKEHERK